MSTFTFISTTEAAELVGVSSETIRQLCKAGTLKYQKRGQLYYPCKEDVNRYANSVTKVYSIKRDIEKYADKLKKDRESLVITQQEVSAQLETLRMFPTNIERIQNLLYSILRQYSPNHIEDFTHREIEVLLMMLRGDSATEIGEKFNISGERIRQIWRNILHRLESTRNLIEIQKEEIEKLKDKILQLEKTKDCFIENTPYYTIPEEILDNIDLLLQPVSAQSFSTRTKRGLDKAHINTVWDLVQCDPKKIRYGLQYIGLKAFNEIEQWLTEHNLKFGLTLPVGIDIMQVKQEVSLNMLDITKK